MDDQEARDYWAGRYGGIGGGNPYSVAGQMGAADAQRERQQQEWELEEARRRRANNPPPPPEPLLNPWQEMWLGRISLGVALVVGLVALMTLGLSEFVIAAMAGALSGGALYVCVYVVAFSVRLLIGLVKWVLTILAMGLVIHASGIADLSGIGMTIWAVATGFMQRWF